MTSPNDPLRADVMNRRAKSVRREGVSRRTWVLVAATAAIAGAFFVTIAVLGAVGHQNAADAFEAAANARIRTYEDQDNIVGELHKAEAMLTADYPSYVTIVTTLTDSTVADPNTRADLLTKVTEYARADLALDDAGVFLAERQALYDARVLEKLVDAENRPLSDFSTEELLAETTLLEEDTKQIRSYIDLVEDATDRISGAAKDAADSTDKLIASAADKGVTLSWDRAPAETAAVVTAAAALIPQDKSDLPLSYRSELVSAYVAAVNTAGAFHQSVLDQEAEAARQAAAEEAARQEAARRPKSNGGTGNQGTTQRNDGGGSKEGAGGNPVGGMGAPNNQHCDGCVANKNVWE